MKRSGISRRTPLSRARLKAKPPVPAAGDGYTSAREAVHARSGSRCEVCGVKIDLASFHAHHRRARSSGRRDDGLANLAACCGPCHNGSDQSIHANPSIASAYGWIISRHDRRPPSMVPILRRDDWCLLTDDGRAIDLPGWAPGP